MTFVKHRLCGVEVIGERLKTTLVPWCPECSRTVDLDELDQRGPFALVNAFPDHASAPPDTMDEVVS